MFTTHIAHRNGVTHKFQSYADAVRFADRRADANELWKIDPVAAGNALDVLEQCEAYFDNRADADCDQDGLIPNKEMQLLSAVREAIAALEAAVGEA